jgi:hypothetical protein
MQCPVFIGAGEGSLHERRVHMFSKDSATYIPRIHLVLILAATLVVIGTTASLAQSFFFTAHSETSDVTAVVVEIYGVFPDDSVSPPSVQVPTRKAQFGEVSDQVRPE